MHAATAAGDIFFNTLFLFQVAASFSAWRICSGVMSFSTLLCLQAVTCFKADSSSSVVRLSC